MSAAILNSVFQNFVFAAEARQLKKLLLIYLYALVPVNLVSKSDFEISERGLFLVTVPHFFRKLD